VKCGGACSERDLVRGWSAFGLWCVPTLLIIAGMFVPDARALLWIPSFAVMGVACLVNARGCGRLHCFVTGPLFLAAALVSAFDAFGIMSMSWKVILAGTGAGTLLAYSLEWMRGKYVATSLS
jgi:hypothetical protein